MDGLNGMSSRVNYRRDSMPPLITHAIKLIGLKIIDELEKHQELFEEQEAKEDKDKEEDK